MDRFSSPESPFPQFSVAEIMKLESIYEEMGEKSLGQDFCQELAKSLSSFSNHAGKNSISWEQVQNWFQNKQKESQAKVTSSPNALKLVVDLSEASILSNSQKSPPSPKDSGQRVEDLSELAFEARSSKDVAWHDVASFLNYRVLSTGELEVRVRYAGFGKEQDEWVNVNDGVRERSIPLEPSECHKVKHGDLVLCFLEREDFALYCDARVVKIQRRLHDRRECRCIFIVRYLHDNTEVISDDFVTVHNNLAISEAFMLSFFSSFGPLLGSILPLPAYLKFSPLLMAMAGRSYLEQVMLQAYTRGMCGCGLAKSHRELVGMKGPNFSFFLSVTTFLPYII